MSADEIRRLSECVETNYATAVGKQERICPEIIAALLAYAAMVERCEEVRTNLELNRKDYANRRVCGSLVEQNNDEIEMVDYILKGKEK